MACGFEISKPASNKATPTNSSQTVLPTRDQAFKYVGPWGWRGDILIQIPQKPSLYPNKEICSILQSFVSSNFTCPSPISDGVCRCRFGAVINYESRAFRDEINILVMPYEATAEG